MGEELQQNEQQNQEVHVPTIEDRAKEQGWRPKEEYEGDPDKWVSAETFVAKGELIDRIESLGKELKNTKKAMDMLKDHHKKVKESEFQRAVEYLKSQKKAAYENGDVDAIMEIDDKIAEVRETQKKQADLVEDTEESTQHPDFVNWVRTNKWYESNADMREEADAIGVAYAKRTKASPNEVLTYVEKQIKKLYPEKFTNPNRNKPSSVEGGGSSSSTKAKEFDIELSDEERQVMNSFVRSGVMTKEEYLAELKKMRNK